MDLHEQKRIFSHFVASLNQLDVVLFLHELRRRRECQRGRDTAVVDNDCLTGFGSRHHCLDCHLRPQNVMKYPLFTSCHATFDTVIQTTLNSLL